MSVSTSMLMVERLGALRKAFPTNYKNAQTNSCLRSLDTDTEDQMDSQKESATSNSGWLATNRPRSHHSTNMQRKKVEMDWSYTEKTDWGHHALGQAVAWNPNGKRLVGRLRRG
ncbi:unnamed protein product [Heterobilharzia americana]|nr:unnamed protein product [Heterobilharzia americana]CAH8477253.1 unnamed protein product [Heterobilharzia americana]